MCVAYLNAFQVDAFGKKLLRNNNKIIIEMTITIMNCILLNLYEVALEKDWQRFNVRKLSFILNIV